MTQLEVSLETDVTETAIREAYKRICESLDLDIKVTGKGPKKS